ncbi:hypothetical protein FOL47_010770 [Perkinsus chesapeaki]|uniref:Uncharacterized protein n=1 Tax=Perkinsus chesapeaki TaxID=330153 RepID=A0A7J6L051_PERCH|nr:hypothetical protein FOL47_010770 [Perkinsus chesapeaki]
MLLYNSLSDAAAAFRFVYSQWIDTYASSKTMGCDIGVKLARLLGPRAILGSKRISADPGCPVSVLAGQENAPGEDEVWCRARITNNQARSTAGQKGYIWASVVDGCTCSNEPPIMSAAENSVKTFSTRVLKFTNTHLAWEFNGQWRSAMSVPIVDFEQNDVRIVRSAWRSIALVGRERLKPEEELKRRWDGDATVMDADVGMECGNCLAQHCACSRQNEEMSKKRLAQVMIDDPFDTMGTPMKILKTEEGQSGLTRHCQCDEPTPYPQNTKTRKSTKQQQQADTPRSDGEDQQEIPPSPPMPFPPPVIPTQPPVPSEPTPMIPHVVALAAAAAVAKVAAKNSSSNSNFSEKGSVDETGKGVTRRRTRRGAGKGGATAGAQNTPREMPYPRIEPMTTRRRTRSMSKDTDGTLRKNASSKDDSSSSASTSSAKPNSSTSATGHKYGDYRTAVRDRRGNVLWTAASGVSCPCHHRKCDQCGLCKHDGINVDALSIVRGAQSDPDRRSSQAVYTSLGN